MELTCRAAQNLTAFIFTCNQKAKCTALRELRACHMLFCSRSVRACFQIPCPSMHGSHKQVFTFCKAESCGGIDAGFPRDLQSADAIIHDGVSHSLLLVRGSTVTTCSWSSDNSVRSFDAGEGPPIADARLSPDGTLLAVQRSAAQLQVSSCTGCIWLLAATRYIAAWPGPESGYEAH